MHYICSRCGKKTPVTTRKARCDCGGLNSAPNLVPELK